MKYINCFPGSTACDIFFIETIHDMNNHIFEEWTNDESSSKFIQNSEF